MFFLGLDLGQSQDSTALVILERIGPSKLETHLVRHLERFALGTPYPKIVKRVSELLLTDPLLGNCLLVVDATGVGRPVIDLLREAGTNPIPVSITGGDTVSRDAAGYWHVPKRDLVACVQILLQSKRLKFANLPHTETLIHELLTFQVKITANANDTYGVWREGSHDDLVLAVALAAWIDEGQNRTVTGAAQVSSVGHLFDSTF